MYKKVLTVALLLLALAGTTIIAGTNMIHNRAWIEIKNNFYKEKIKLMDYYFEQNIDNMSSLLYSHAVWTDTGERVVARDSEWLYDNASGYLVDEEEYDIDFVMITNEELTFTDKYGDDIIDNIKETDSFKTALYEDTFSYELIWIKHNPMILMCSPLLDNDYNNPFGVYTMGRFLDNEELAKLKDILGNDSVKDLTISQNRIHKEIVNDNYSIVKFSHKINIDNKAFINVSFNTPVYNKIFYVHKGHIFAIIITVALISIIIALMYFKRIVNSIQEVIRVVTRISHGDYSKSATKTNIPELNQLVEAINKMSLDITSRMNEIDENFLSMIEIMVNAVEMNDSYTSHHSSNVAEYSRLIGSELEFEDMDTLYAAARLHDIGKISIPKDILNKPGKLTIEEYRIIKEHPVAGHQLMDNINYFNEIKKGVLYHHERYDGKGYPEGLKEDEIPFVAQIISVADVFDALASDRPYRKAFSYDEALSIIKKNSGTMFNPVIVDAFITALSRFPKLENN